MAPERSPAFQFYPKDFLTDGRVAAMTLEECGAYIKLLCLCWTETTLPTEPRRLAQMIGCSPRAFERVWPALQVCFSQVDGGFRHGRLDEEREKQELYRQRQAAAGRASAATKGLPKGNQTATTVQPRLNQTATGGQPDPQPDSSLLLRSPISDLPSPGESVKNTLSLAASKPIQTAITTGDHGERAGRLVERFGELFVAHRYGAKYRQRPNLDWHDALTLVPLWDDARLEKLAVIFLTSTRDEWINRTDRSFKIFAMKASQMDQWLTEWEAENGIKVTA